METRLLEQRRPGVGARLRASGHVGRTIAIKVRLADFRTVNRSRTVPTSTDVAREIFETSWGLFRALGANPVSMNWGEALTAFHQGTVDGHENPLALIIPYRLWEIQRHVTLWHYAIDPLVLAVSGKTWMSLSAEDRTIVRKAGEEIMAVQKREAREGLDREMTLPTTLQQLYGMEVVQLSPAEVQAFRQKTRPVYNKWASEIGVELVRRAERIVGDSGR